MRQQPPRPHRSVAGFTVLESLVSLGLIALTLAILGSLLMSYLTLNRNSGDREKTIMGCQVAAESIRRDASSSLVVQIPSSSQLHLEQIDPLVTSRLPDPLPATLPGSFRPHENADRLKIDYRLEGDQVMRWITYSNGATFDESVSADVDGLSFSMLTNGNLEVVATANINGLIHSWKVEILLHRPEELYP